MTGQRRAFTSIRAKLMIGDVHFGWVNNFSASETFNNVPVREFGDARVQIHETVAYDVTGSFSYIHILDKPLAGPEYSGKIWITPNWGDREAANLAVITFVPKTITLVDWVSNQPVLTIHGFKPASRDFQLSEGGLTMVNATFVAVAMVEHDVPIVTPGGEGSPISGSGFEGVA